jgi:hypothetical protein
MKVTVELNDSTVAAIAEEEEESVEEYVRRAIKLRRITDTPQETLALIDEETDNDIPTAAREGGL